MPIPRSRRRSGAGPRPGRYVDFDRCARHRPCSLLSPDKLLAHYVILRSHADDCPTGNHCWRMCVRHTDYDRRVVPLVEKNPTAVQQRLPRGTANHLVGVFEAGVEPAMTALAAMIKGRRNDDDDLGHHSRTLRDDGRWTSEVDRTNGPILPCAHSSRPDVGYNGVRPASRKGGPSELAQAIFASVFGEQGIP